MSKVEWDRVHYTNGALMRETPHVNNKRHGVAKDWYDNGTLRFEASYVNGHEHGVEKHWCDNGTLKRETPWVNGQAHGVEKYYHEDGTLKQKIYYINGQRRPSLSPLRSWSSSGKRLPNNLLIISLPLPRVICISCTATDL